MQGFSGQRCAPRWAPPTARLCSDRKVEKGLFPVAAPGLPPPESHSHGSKELSFSADLITGSLFSFPARVYFLSFFGSLQLRQRIPPHLHPPPQSNTASLNHSQHPESNNKALPLLLILGPYWCWPQTHCTPRQLKPVCSTAQKGDTIQNEV